MLTLQWSLLVLFCLPFQNTCRNPQNRKPASTIEAGSVSTHAIARLRTVDHCRPDWFAAMVPAIPDDSVLAERQRGSNFGIGDGFRSILRDMAEKKTDRSACRFTVQQAKDGKPFIAVQLYRDTIPVLREVSFGFDLLRGTQVEDAKKLAEMLNEQVLDMFVTTGEKAPPA